MYIDLSIFFLSDCIECMACSDNVIRAGLTPKFKDVETLIGMLNYEAHPASHKIFEPKIHPTYDYVKLFVPKVKDFAVAQIQKGPSNATFEIDNRKHGSIILVLSGDVELKKPRGQSISLSEGSIVFVPADHGKKIEFTFKSLGSGNPFVAYQAMYNDFE